MLSLSVKAINALLKRQNAKEEEAEDTVEVDSKEELLKESWFIKK